MRDFAITIAGAIGGAAMAVAVVFIMASSGFLPINDRQLQTYLMLHPDLAPAMMGRAQQMDDAKAEARQQAAVDKAGQASLFDPKLAFVTGPANAKKTLVEFFDYDCPYCRASLPALHKYYDAHKSDTRFSFIEFPIASLHGPGAVAASLASLAARRQPEHFLDFHFALMAEDDSITPEIIFADAAKAGLDVNRLKADMNDPAIQKTLDASLALSMRLGVNATPTFVFNGTLHSGAVDDAALADALKS
jgi:protein-disulfide isomerase